MPRRDPLEATLEQLSIARADPEQVDAVVNRREDGSLGAFFKEVFDSR